MPPACGTAAPEFLARCREQICPQQRRPSTLSVMANYDDGGVALTDSELIIRHYYLPLPKRIRYSAIRAVRETPMSWMGKWRIQGSSDFIHWFNFDARRPRKDTALVIYLDGRIRPVITPDDPNAVVTELAAHGVNVTRGREPGLI
jgi:hypothetical protein